MTRATILQQEDIAIIGAGCAAYRSHADWWQQKRYLA